MKRYTLFCTDEQTKNALELGAPISSRNSIIVPPRWVEINGAVYESPTAEQMTMWLEEKEITYFLDVPDKLWDFVLYDKDSYIRSCEGDGYPSIQEVIIAAIDAALDYLKTKED